MPAPLIIPREGTTIGYSATSGGTYVTIGGIISIKKPGAKVNPVKTTQLSSTVQTFRPGLQPEVGEASFRIQYDPNQTDHIAFAGDLTTPVLRWFKIIFPDSNVTTKAFQVFQGFITTWDEDEDSEEGNVEVEVTIQVTGVVTRTVGTP